MILPQAPYKGQPVRIQLSRRKGFKLQAESLALNGLPAVKVDRSTKWGNPFNFKSAEYCWIALSFGCRADPAGRRAASVLAFKNWITPIPGKRLVSHEFGVCIEAKGKKVAIGARASAGSPPSIDEIRAGLGGKNIACWCPTPKDGGPDHCHGAVLLELANKGQIE